MPAAFVVSTKLEVVIPAAVPAATGAGGRRRPSCAQSGPRTAGTAALVKECLRTRVRTERATAAVDHIREIFFKKGAL